MSKDSTEKKQVIVVTDGDRKASEAVRVASDNVGGYCVIASQKPNEPKPTSDEVKQRIREAPCSLVIVLVDDQGKQGEGRGESILRDIASDDQFDLLGVVAVASDMHHGNGAVVNVSVNREGELVQTPVGKDGREQFASVEIHGDTVENLDELDIPIVVGLGDPGKMDFADDAKKGAPVTTKALEVVILSS